MTTSIHFWLRCFLWVASGSVLGSALVTLLRGELKIEEGAEPWKRIVRILIGVETTRFMTKIALAFFIYIAGYATRDLVLLRRTEILSNVEVKQVYNEYAYNISYGFGMSENIHLCPESAKIVKLQVGERFTTFVYEQKVGCKSIVGSNLGFFH